MPFPRRPRDESPAVTIRWQRRQMAQMEQTIDNLRGIADELKSDIGRIDVEKSERETELFDMARRLDDVSVDLANTKAAASRNAERLAYLEGYFYAKEAAVQQTPILASGGPIFRHQSNTYAGTSPRNPQGVQDGRQAAESAGFDPGAAGFGETAGDQIPSERADYRSHPGKRSVEHVEITDARDGLTKWANNERLW